MSGTTIKYLRIATIIFLIGILINCILRLLETDNSVYQVGWLIYYGLFLIYFLFVIRLINKYENTRKRLEEKNS